MNVHRKRRQEAPQIGGGKPSFLTLEIPTLA
jgi:hypothetical protein